MIVASGGLRVKSFVSRASGPATYLLYIFIFQVHLFQRIRRSQSQHLFAQAQKKTADTRGVWSCPDEADQTNAFWDVAVILSFANILPSGLFFQSLVGRKLLEETWKEPGYTHTNISENSLSYITHSSLPEPKKTTTVCPDYCKPANICLPFIFAFFSFTENYKNEWNQKVKSGFLEF